METQPVVAVGMVKQAIPQNLVRQVSHEEISYFKDNEFFMERFASFEFLIFLFVCVLCRLYWQTSHEMCVSVAIQVMAQSDQVIRKQRRSRYSVNKSVSIRR